MKALRITLFFFIFALLTPFANVSASTAISAKEARESVVKKALSGKVDGLVDAFKGSRIAKKMAKLQKRFGNGKAIDLQDPVNKWMWFWIFGWGAGLLLFIIGGVVAVGGAASGSGAGFGVGAIFSLLGVLCSLFGTVSLVIWLVKKFGGA
jgi:hypothetical protein